MAAIYLLIGILGLPLCILAIVSIAGGVMISSKISRMEEAGEFEPSEHIHRHVP